MRGNTHNAHIQLDDDFFRNFHRSCRIVDAHCDILVTLRENNCCLNEERTSGHLDLPRLVRGGVKVLFFAAFVRPYLPGGYLKRALELAATFYRETKNSHDYLVPVFAWEDLLLALEQGKMASILTIEGGEALEGSIEVLQMLHRLGVRGLTLTWNYRNALGDGVAELDTRGGLTKFGKAVVREMNRLRMVVDVAHLSPAGFWDVLETSSAPVIASHCNSFRICPHPRNLTDEQVRAIAAAGGVIGVTFVPAFVCSTNPSLERLLDHIGHLVEVGGIDCVGLGSDFEGFDGFLPGLEDVTRLPHLTESLLKRGYAPHEVRKIMGENFLRVLEEVLPASR